MSTFVNAYRGGMDRDSSPNNYPNDKYYDLRNFRLITDDAEGLSNDALTNSKGNSLLFKVPLSGKIIGSTILRDALILFVKDSSNSKIYRIDKDKLPSLGGAFLNTEYYHKNPTTNNLIYQGNLGFDENYPIHAIGNYENEYVQKIYWVDELHALRHLNIIYDVDTNDLESLDESLLNIVPENLYGTIDTDIRNGGNLYAGRIQYAYQLYTVNGSETYFSPTSSLINLSSYTTSEIVKRNAAGSNEEEMVNKAVNVTITLDTSIVNNFNRIRLVSLYYKSYEQIPIVNIIAESKLESEVITLTDYGYSIGTLTLEQFQFLQNVIKPSDLAVRKNHLFVANVQYENFDIDSLGAGYIDTRAYRYRAVNTIGSGSSSGSTINQNDSFGYTSPTVISFNSYNNEWYLEFECDLDGDVAISGREFVDYVASHNYMYGNSPSAGGDYIEVECTIPNDGMETIRLVLDNGIVEQYFNPTGGANGSIYLHGTMYESGYEPVNMTYDSTHIGGVVYTYYTYKISYPEGVNATAGSGGTLNGTYFYKVSAYDGTHWTGLSPEVSATVDGGTTNGTITVSWTAISGVTKYRVWRGTVSGGENEYYEIVNPPLADDGSLTFTAGNPPSSYECMINKGMTGELTVDPSTYYSVPHDHDCINTFNNIENDGIYDGSTTDLTYGFKYKANASGVTFSDLGGSGPLISYEFIENKVVDMGWSAAYNTHYWTTFISSYLGYSDENTIKNFIGYQRDELYRFAIVFYDLYGRPSFPKWIADIRMPNFEESNSYGSELKAVPLGIKFTINWDEARISTIKDKISGYRFYRVPVGEGDKSILAQGVLVPVGNMKDTDYYSIPGFSSFQELKDGYTHHILSIQQSGKLLSKSIFEFISPEYSFNKKSNLSGSEMIEVFGVLKEYISSSTEQSYISSYTLQEKEVGIGTTSGGNTLLSSDNITHVRRDIIYNSFVTPKEKNPAAITIGSINYFPRVSEGSREAYKGSSLLIQLSSDLDSTYLANDSSYEHAMLANIRNKLGYSAYGGNTYVQRALSHYIPIHGFKKVGSGLDSTEVYGGNTYINTFHQLHGMLDIAHQDNSIGTFQSYICFPVESQINIDYRLDPMIKYMKWDFPGGMAGYESYSLMETEMKGIEAYPQDYPAEVGDLYRYNSVYSQDDKSSFLTPKPFDFRSTDKQDYRIMASDLKYPGEYSDSWLNFKDNNYIDVDSNYGAITRLINFKDKLVTIQPKGIAIISSLERETKPSSNIGELVLGTGTLLQRYDYIDTNTGTEWYNAVIYDGSSLMYYDSILKQIMIVTQKGIEPISEIKGLKSYYSGVTVDNMITAYDKENREVLFTPTNNTPSYLPTLAFSGFKNYFKGFYDLSDMGDTPVQKYIHIDKYLMMTIDFTNIYLYNNGDYGKFFDDIKPSSITLIVNPMKDQPVRYNVIKWLSDVIYSGNNIVDVTLDSIRIEDTYQNTGVINLVPQTSTTSGNVVRRERLWRFDQFRDSISHNGRLKDSYFKVTLSFNNTNDYKIIVYNLISDISPTKIR